MATTRKALAVLIAPLAGVGLLTGVAYVAGLSPFEKRGSIDAGEVCESLGTSGKVIPALERVMPNKSRYYFNDEVNSRAHDTDDNYTSACFVRGDAQQIISVRAEMMLIGPEPTQKTADGWADDQIVANGPDKRPLKTFNAGNGAVASSRTSAILVPCTPPGQIPGGEYDLTVVVTLKQKSESSDAKTRQSLIDLVRSAAEYAHKNARCDLPSKL
ncbi:hypothetical protein ACFO9E_31710 [Streptomyces maoxianensis]|uniref:Secreted protein n=1 Tax=Streptomyces maoxianensis TaxID=1459942 RepID=A0ABV9GI22_9ACTN